jgi:hypothetical protein
MVLQMNASSHTRFTLTEFQHPYRRMVLLAAFDTAAFDFPVKFERVFLQRKACDMVTVRSRNAAGPGGVEASLGPFANYLPAEVVSVQNCTGPDERRISNDAGPVKHEPPVKPDGWLYESETFLESSIVPVSCAGAVRICGTTWLDS